MAGRFTKQEEIARLLSFGSATAVGPYMNAALDGQKIAAVNIEWNNNYIGKVREYFKLKKNSATTSIISSVVMVAAVLVYFV